MKSCKIMMICLFVSIGLFAHANETEELTGFTRVMSYDELMTLSPEKRIDYVQGLRELLKEMEQTEQYSAQTDSLRQMLRVFEAWIPEAQAAQGVDPRVSAVPAVESAHNISVVRCPKGTEALRVRGAEKSVRPTFYVCQVGGKTMDLCPNGFVAVMQDADSKFRCASRASFDNLSATSRLIARTKNRRAASRAEHAKANSNFDAGGPSAASLQAIVDQQKAADKKHAEAAEKAEQQAAEKAAKEAARKAAQKPAQKAVPKAVQEATRKKTAKAADSTPQKPANQADRVAVQRPSRAADRTDVKPKQGEESTSAESREGESAAASNESAESDEAGQTEAQAGTQPSRGTASLSSCSPNATLSSTCTASRIEAARKKYASDANPDCIYAGSVSVYKDGQKKSFACMPPTKFCFGSGNCASEIGTKMEAAYSCASGQVICNPMLFGIKSDGETPFCVSRQKNATLACESESSGEKAHHPFLSSKAKPTGWKKTTGLREAWDEFARRLFQLCHKNQTSMVLHCRECHVIKKRLFDLNVAVRGVKNCGAALLFQRERCEPNGKCAQPARNGNRGSTTVAEQEQKTDRIPATDSPDQTPSIEVPGEKPSDIEAQPDPSSNERSNSRTE